MQVARLVAAGQGDEAEPARAAAARPRTSLGSTLATTTALLLPAARSTQPSNSTTATCWSAGLGSAAEMAVGAAIAAHTARRASRSRDSSWAAAAAVVAAATQAWSQAGSL